VSAAQLADAPRAAVIENHHEVLLTHPKLLRMKHHEIALTASTPIFTRFRQSMLRANALVSGARTDLASRVRAAQAIAMLSDPVVLFADERTDALRAHVLSGVRRLLDDGSPSAIDASGPTKARRGRPKAVSPKMLEDARRLRDAGAPVATIAAQLGVSRATLYRALVSK
jgi:hypothetical protein